MKIATLILGKTDYNAETVGLTLAVTFSKNIDLNSLYLEVKQDGKTIEFTGLLKDAIDTFKKHDTLQPSSRHIHFLISGLIPNKHFTYQIKRKDHKPVYIEKAFNEEIGQLHNPIIVNAPPAPGQRTKYRVTFGADQEAMDAIRTIKLDDTIANLLGLNLAQRELTGKIYSEIKNLAPDMMLHGGDIMLGENFIPYQKVEELAEFRKHIAADFHEIVRDDIAGIVAYRGLDDHDLGANGTSAVEFGMNSKGIKNGINAFNEFWPVPTVTEDKNRGLFYNTSYGDIEIWFLHNRIYNLKSESLLGETQKNWLNNSLHASNALVKFVVTPLPFVMGKKPSEDYRSVPSEWNELLHLFAKTGVSAIFTGDSHDYSRSDITMNVNGEKVTIPQLLVGTFGGRPQQIEALEKKNLPQPLVPELYNDAYAKSRVQAYYTAISKPDGEFSLQNSKKFRAYKNEKWIGKECSKNCYGYLKVDIDMDNKSILTSFKALRNKHQGEKRHIFTDEGHYPLRTKMKI